MDRNAVAASFIDAIAMQPEEDISAMVQCMESDLLKSFFQELLFAMMMRMAYHLGRDDLLLKIVGVVKDVDFRSRMLLQFGFVDEAGTVVFENGLRALVPLVGHYKGFDGKKGLFAKCMKFLE
jgi:hypothetical protein